MDIKQRLDQNTGQWALLKHPFYQAWRAGTLPVDALRTYAREYGAFISLLPQAWQVLEDPATAQEEREHLDMWRGFAAGLATEIGPAQIPEVAGLTANAETLFADPASALGALYAFEVQQPATAQSKLDGLRAFYQLPASVERYFEVHAHNEHEAERLLHRIRALPAGEQERAAQACAALSRALWDALSGIYEKECVQN